MFKLRALTALALASLLVSTLILTLTGCSGSAPGTDQYIRDRFSSIQDEFESLQTDIDDQRLAISDLADQVNTLAEEGVVATGDGGASSAALASLRSADTQTAEEIRQLKEQIADLEDALRQLRMQVADNAVSAHQQSSNGSTTAREPERETQVTSAPEPEPEPAPSRPRGVWYTVESGDTLDSIAEEYGASVSAILQVNGLPDGNITLAPGFTLLIPE